MSNLSRDTESVQQGQPESSRRAARAREAGGSGGESSVMSIDASGSAGSRSASLRQVLSDLDGGAPGGLDRGDQASSGTLMDLWDDLEDT